MNVSSSAVVGEMSEGAGGVEKGAPKCPEGAVDWPEGESEALVELRLLVCA